MKSRFQALNLEGQTFFHGSLLATMPNIPKISSEKAWIGNSDPYSVIQGLDKRRIHWKTISMNTHISKIESK